MPKFLKMVCGGTAIDSSVAEEMEVQLLPFGRHKTVKGEFTVNEYSLARVPERFALCKNDIVVDYEHQTLEGTEAPASGWISEIVSRGKDGLWAKVRWTARALEYLRNREYRYLSPVFLVNEATGIVEEILNAALTNYPAIDGMQPIVAKRESQTEEEVDMDMKQLLAALGLPETATWEEAIETVKRLAQLSSDVVAATGIKPGEVTKEALMAMKAPAIPGKVMEAIGLPAGSGMSEFEGAVLAMKATSIQHAELQKENVSLKEKLATIEAEGIVAMAMKDGIITPAQKDWALNYARTDRAGFDSYVKHAVPVIKPGQTTIVAKKGEGGEDEMTPERQAIREQLHAK